MGKIITSPIKRFAGTVTLADPLTYPQLIAWEDCIDRARAHEPEPDAQDSEKSLRYVDIARRPRLSQIMLPGIIACVEKWELAGFPENVTEETFPSTPRISAGLLLVWLIDEINKLYDETGEIPNA